MIKVCHFSIEVAVLERLQFNFGVLAFGRKIVNLLNLLAMLFSKVNYSRTVKCVQRKGN